MEPPPELHSEIRARLGVMPNFFRLAPEAPQIASSLWEFAKFGYLDNPLPALFKERLFVSLSRFCQVRYCISRHVGFLIGLGRPAGDPGVRPETVEQTVALLRRALPRGDDLQPHLARIAAAPSPAKAVPEPGSSMEEAVFDCAAHVFLQTTQAARCLEALSRVFEPAAFQHLLVFLTFVRTAHFWTVIHPELEVEDDIAEVLRIHEALAECVVSQPEPINETLQTLLDERESLRRERQLRQELEQTNAKLREERKRLQVTLASIGDAVLTTDTDGRILNMNPVAEKLTRWTNDAAKGLPLERVFRIVDEATGEPADNPAARALRDGVVQSISMSTLLIAKDGTARPVDDSAAPIRSADGNIVGCVLTFRDVSERRKTHETAELMAAIVDSSDDAIISKSLDGVIKTWNAAAERLFGYSAEQAIGRHITMLIPPDLIGEEDMIISRIKANERVDHFDTVRLRRDGSPVEVSVTISPVKGLDGAVIGASKVARDITERRRTEATLRKVAEDAAEADRKKDRFLAILAHELRNPLAPIRSCIQLLKADSAAAETQRSLSQSATALAIMDRQVSQMVRLIDDLLDISRISRGKLELRWGEVALQKVIHLAIESIEPLLTANKNSIALELPDRTIALRADEARLTQVFANLLTNATKYSPAGGTITLRAVAEGDRARVSVVDDGVGIPADKLEAIFDMFSQIEGAPHAAQGLGIGLTMARELVELHRGRLTASSDGHGKGATFTVTLPLPSGPERARGEVAAGDREADPAGSGLKVLVVDDSRDSANALSMLLSLRGCEVRTEFDGPSALRTAQEFVPDLVFLDIGMPGMSGLEAAEHIRRAPWGQDLLLVALSGWGQAGDREKTKNAGFDEHLIKPADISAIQRILTQAQSR